MSRQSRLILLGLIILISIVYNLSEIAFERSYEDSKEKDTKELADRLNSPIEEPKIEYHPRPAEGFSPYDKYFGKGIYDKNSLNSFIIENSNSSDAVVLLVNAFTKRKVRNEFIRKGSTFEMTSVPNGTYYLEWTSGEDWSPNIDLGKVVGGFQTNRSNTKTKGMDDWMKVTGREQWTVTLFTTQGGDVESENLDDDEFGT
jgi:hypothetical protein